MSDLKILSVVSSPGTSHTASLRDSYHVSVTCHVTRTRVVSLPEDKEIRWWQLKLNSPELIQAVSVTIKSYNKQHFSIFVIEILLDGSNALYKPCSEFEGVLRKPRVMFDCNEG